VSDSPRSRAAVLGYTTLRLAIGMSMLIHGATRIGRIPAFESHILSQFSGTWLPKPALVVFAHLTPPVELLIGALVLPGLFTRLGLFAGGVWMVILIFGSTLVASYDVVGIQLLYSLIFFVLLEHEDWNELSLDRMLRGSRLPRSTD
jgi:thiosulfate dehydrogenase [quinone] large subunit